MAEYQATAPVREDIRFDDHEFNPALEPKNSRAWLNLLEESEAERDATPWLNTILICRAP
jgi:hypothetical protein